MLDELDTPEGDDELDFDADLDDEDDAPAEPEADAEPEAAPAEAAPAPSAEAAQAEAVALAVVKDTWAEIAQEKYPLADVSAIGLTGVDKAARATFEEAAKASHEAKIEALKKQGFVYSPEAVDEADQDARDEILANAWGRPVTGSQEASMDEQTFKAVQESAQAGDVDGTIRHLIGGGQLGKFFVKGKR